MSAALVDFIAAEIGRQVQPAVAAFAAELAARGRGKGVAGVLFYGSALRTGATDGMLDFYVLLDDLADWDQSRFATAANRVLPPNIEYAESVLPGVTLRAKIAIMSLSQFRAHARAESYDTTIWARFSQPCGLVYRRDEAAGRAIAEAVSIAARGAAWWAARLGPASAPALAFWSALFSRTYASELRVESAARPSSIVEGAAARYEALLRLAWAADGLAFTETPFPPSPLWGGVGGGGDSEEDEAARRPAAQAYPAPRPPLPTPQGGGGGGVAPLQAIGEVSAMALAPALTEPERLDAERAWRRRSRRAKPLNLSRLAKAAFTFSGGADYVAWKIERHSGHKVLVTPFQRRHPLLAAGPALWRLWRKGVLR